MQAQLSIQNALAQAQAIHSHTSTSTTEGDGTGGDGGFFGSSFGYLASIAQDGTFRIHESGWLRREIVIGLIIWLAILTLFIIIAIIILCVK